MYVCVFLFVFPLPFPVFHLHNCLRFISSASSSLWRFSRLAVARGGASLVAITRQSNGGHLADRQVAF